MKRVIILFLVVFNGFFSSNANAALSCPQLVAVSQTTISLRDEGHSLLAVLAEIERAEMRAHLDAQAINLLRQIARISFTSEFSPREVHEVCVSGSLGKPKPKPKPKP